jgi:predicted DNA-binding transcriptional regulator YafY
MMDLNAVRSGPRLRDRIEPVLERPLSRLLTMLELLQAYRRLSGTELARRLEVAPRTVRRYVSMLQDMGIPVDAETGRHGGYRLRPGYRLPPLMLTDDEALAVVLGLLAGRRLGVIAATSAAEGALAKLDRVLPDALRGRVRAAQQAVELSLSRAAVGQRVDAGLLLVLGGATHDRRGVRISYRARGGQATERALDPYGVVFEAGRWYLVGWDHLRQAERTFRLDRVQDVRVTDRTFSRPEDFDTVARVQRSIATAPWPWTVEALLALAPAAARERVAPTIGTLEERPDGVLVRFGADDLDWAARYLVGLECRFAVRGPPELRERLRDLSAAIAATAEPPPAPPRTAG